MVIDISQPPYSASPGNVDNAPAFQAAFASLELAGGGKLIVPGEADQWRIASTIGFSKNVDTSLRIALEGAGGRRSAQITQTAAVPCFQLKTSSGNIRDFTARGITFRGGTVGVDLGKDAYNLFDDCVLTLATSAGVRCSNGSGVVATKFSNCWWVNVPGSCAQGLIGTLHFSGCLFGEQCGGFVMENTQLRLVHCEMHDCSSSLPEVLGEGAAVIRLTSGASLIIEGGDYRTADTVMTFIYVDKSRDVRIRGGAFRVNQCTSFIANRYAHLGAKPYAPLVLQPSLVHSEHTAQPLFLYRQLETGGGKLIHAHEDALIECGATEYVALAPTVSPEFSDPGKRNVLVARSRVDQAT
jgi:hypothetical protein